MQVIDFSADPPNPTSQWSEHTVDRQTIDEVLTSWHRVSQDHWKHGYSHVALHDRTGRIELVDGTTIRWMVKPGGLATLVLANGETVYLAEQLTRYEGDADTTKAGE